MKKCLQFYGSHSKGHSFPTGFTCVPHQFATLQSALVRRLLVMPQLPAREVIFLMPCAERRPVPPCKLVVFDAPDTVTSMYQDWEAILVAIYVKTAN